MLFEVVKRILEKHCPNSKSLEGNDAVLNVCGCRPHLMAIPLTQESEKTFRHSKPYPYLIKITTLVQTFISSMVVLLTSGPVKTAMISISKASIIWIPIQSTRTASGIP